VKIAVCRARVPAGGRVPLASARRTPCRPTRTSNDNRQGVDHMNRLIIGLLAATALTVPAMAEEIRPGLLFDLGGKFDKSFNEASYEGAEMFKNETDIEYVEFEISNEAQREQALRRFAEDGRNPIVMAGFSWASCAGDRRPRLSRHRFRHHRHGCRPAQCPLHRLQGAGRLLPRRSPGGHEVGDRHGRLHRRHGNPADRQVRMRLCRRREGGR
jgi:hypothetical protein